MTDEHGNRNGLPQSHGDGPAFPVSIPGAGDNGWHGMSLRDWFAGMALSGLLQNMDVQGSFDYGASRNAQAAYDLADAMLEARPKPGRDESPMTSGDGQ